MLPNASHFVIYTLDASVIFMLAAMFLAIALLRIKITNLDVEVINQEREGRALEHRDSPRSRSAVPIIGEFLLYLFLIKGDRQNIPGDLEEEFILDMIPKFGEHAAKFWYYFQVLRTIAYRNVLCRFLFIGGGIFKVIDWWRKILG
jgi:hypothetical protein